MRGVRRIEMHVFLRREQEAGGGEVDIQICGAASTPTCKFPDDFLLSFTDVITFWSKNRNIAKIASMKFKNRKVAEF